MLEEFLRESTQHLVHTKSITVLCSPLDTFSSAYPYGETLNEYFERGYATAGLRLFSAPRSHSLNSFIRLLLSKVPRQQLECFR